MIDAPSLSCSCSIFRLAILKYEWKSLGISGVQKKMELSGAMVGSCSEQVSLKVKPTISACLLRSKLEAAPINPVALGIFGSPSHYGHSTSHRGPGST